MKQFISTLSVLLVISLNSFGQKENLEDISNRLFCNVYDYVKADSLTFKFLKENFPYLTEEKSKGGWIGLPIGADAKKSIESMHFKKHPFFDFKLEEGHLDFFTVEVSGFKFETGAELWLIFENLNDAELAFKELIDTFTSVSTYKNINEEAGRTVGKFSGSGTNNQASKGELVLIKDEDNNIYKIHYKNWYNDN